MSIKIAETKSFKEMKTKLPQRHFPGCEKHKLLSDAYWECYIRQNAFTLYHPV